MHWPGPGLSLAFKGKSGAKRCSSPWRGESNASFKPESPSRYRKLVDAILGGDPDAFSELQALYSQRLYRFAIKRLGDPTEAEDVVQDVFLEVHRCLKSWQGRSALLTWMFGITHHQICRRFRRKTPISVSLEELEAAPPVSPEAPNDRRVDAVRVLEVCAETLDEDVSPAQREIFDLYYGESFSREGPVILDGALRDADFAGNLRDRQPAEDLECDDEGHALMFLRESFEGLFGDSEAFVIRCDTRENGFIQLLLGRPAAALARAVASCVIDQDMAHDAGRTL